MTSEEWQDKCDNQKGTSQEEHAKSDQLWLFWTVMTRQLQMLTENIGNNILKKIPGCEEEMVRSGKTTVRKRQPASSPEPWKLA